MFILPWHNLPPIEKYLHSNVFKIWKWFITVCGPHWLHVHLFQITYKLFHQIRLEKMQVKQTFFYHISPFSKSIINVSNFMIVNVVLFLTILLFLETTKVIQWFLNWYNVSPHFLNGWNSCIDTLGMASKKGVW